MVFFNKWNVVIIGHFLWYTWITSLRYGKCLFLTYSTQRALSHVQLLFQHFNRSPHVSNLERANIYLWLRARREKQSVSRFHLAQRNKNASVMIINFSCFMICSSLKLLLSIERSYWPESEDSEDKRVHHHILIQCDSAFSLFKPENVTCCLYTAIW